MIKHPQQRRREQGFRAGKEGFAHPEACPGPPKGQILGALCTRHSAMPATVSEVQKAIARRLVERLRTSDQAAVVATSGRSTSYSTA
jgi:hypothetical protein